MERNLQKAQICHSYVVVVSLLTVTALTSFALSDFNKITFFSSAFAAVIYYKISNSMQSLQQDGEAVEGFLCNKTSTADVAHLRETMYEVEDLLEEILQHRCKC